MKPHFTLHIYPPRRSRHWLTPARLVAIGIGAGLAALVVFGLGL